MKPEMKDRMYKIREDQLILFHQSYGAYIRNKWFLNNRNPELISYFRSRGYKHPDGMSMEILKYLWRDLHQGK